MLMSISILIGYVIRPITIHCSTGTFADILVGLPKHYATNITPHNIMADRTDRGEINGHLTF